MTKDEVLKLALEALLHVYHEDEAHPKTLQAITAIKEALAQPEQEPDWKGLVLSHNADCESRCDMERCKYAPYFKANGRRCPTCPVYEVIDVDYTPPQRKPLTQQDLAHLWMQTNDYYKFARAIEAAHGIKENT